jgi:hypothetical protein
MAAGRQGVDFLTLGGVVLSLLAVVGGIFLE